MRLQRKGLAIGGIVLLAVGGGLTLLAGRDEPIHPDLGPAVQVRLSTARPSSTPTAPTTREPAERARTQNRTDHPSSSSTPSGARSVPRHLPASAGDDQDDHDDDADIHDNDDDADDHDGDVDEDEEQKRPGT